MRKTIYRTVVSPFRQRVLSVVSALPKGSTLSYKEVARRAGNPKAARAVGAIMRVNHDPSMPCHRVIRSDGRLGGYNGGGIAGKKAKLQQEGYFNKI